MNGQTDSHSMSFERWWNVRDLGGLPTSDGVATRSGVLIRAASPQFATPADIDQARRLGLTTFVDLRMPGHPSDWRVAAPEVTTVSVDVVGSLKRPPDAPVPQMLCSLLDGCRAEVARAVDEISRLALESPPVVFHCHTGKDRTGLIAIVMLLLASVPEEAIIADYLASNPGFEAMRAALTVEGGADFMPGAPAAFQGPVSPSGAEAVLGFLRESGGAGAYLESGGLTAAAIDRAASLLV